MSVAPLLVVTGAYNRDPNTQELISQETAQQVLDGGGTVELHDGASFETLNAGMGTLNLHGQDTGVGFVTGGTVGIYAESAVAKVKDGNITVFDGGTVVSIENGAVKVNHGGSLRNALGGTATLAGMVNHTQGGRMPIRAGGSAVIHIDIPSSTLVLHRDEQQHITHISGPDGFLITGPDGGDYLPPTVIITAQGQQIYPPPSSSSATESARADHERREEGEY